MIFSTKCAVRAAISNIIILLSYMLSDGLQRFLSEIESDNPLFQTVRL